MELSSVGLNPFNSLFKKMKRFVRLFALFMFALSGLVWADSNVDIVIDPGETYAIQ